MEDKKETQVNKVAPKAANVVKAKASSEEVVKTIKLNFELERDEEKAVIAGTMKVRRTAAGYRPGSSERLFADVSLVDLEARPAYYAKMYPKLEKRMSISDDQKEALDKLTLNEIEQAYANS